MKDYYTKYIEDSNQIRILPMTSRKDLESEFYHKSSSEMHDIFFKARLANDGKYKIRRASKFATPEDVFVLFQFNNHIIAGAFLERYINEPDDDYIGVYVFKTDSVIVFDSISEREFNDTLGTNIKFSNATHIIDKKKHALLRELLEKKKY